VRLVQRLPAPDVPAWLARLVPYERYLVDVGGWRMHVMESGVGRPVLLMHGNPTWGVLYRKVAAALAGEPLRLVMPDLIGFGLSDKPRDATLHTLDNHARWLGALVDGLDLDGLIMVGQDWGGPIGLRALADRPHRAAGLVLMNTPAGPPRDGFRPTLFHRFARLPLVSDLVFKGIGFPQVGLNLAQGTLRSITGDAARAYRYPFRAIGDRVAPLAMAREVPDSLEHRAVEPLRRCAEFVDGFDGPAALVWGDRDPVLGRLAGRVERALPQATMTHTSAGHFLQEQVPDEIAAAIRDVASKLD
jgi:haloalkane dehalogenase